MGRLRSSMLIVTFAVAALLLSACGDDTGDAAERPSDAPTDTTSEAAGTATPTPSEPATKTLPACTDIWVADADLPKKYQGCSDGDLAVEPEVVECSSGQRIVIYDDAYWALRGHVIKHAPEGLKESSAYADVLYGCRA